MMMSDGLTQTHEVSERKEDEDSNRKPTKIEQ